MYIFRCAVFFTTKALRALSYTKGWSKLSLPLPRTSWAKSRDGFSLAVQTALSFGGGYSFRQLVGNFQDIGDAVGSGHALHAALGLLQVKSGCSNQQRFLA